MRALSRSSCSIALPVVVLPHPDSPTSANVRRRRIERDAVDGLEVADRALQKALANREVHAVVANMSAAGCPMLSRCVRRLGASTDRGQCLAAKAGIDASVLYKHSEPVLRYRFEQRRRRCDALGMHPWAAIGKAAAGKQLIQRRHVARNGHQPSPRFSVSGNAASNSCAYGCSGRAKNTCVLRPRRSGPRTSVRSDVPPR